MYSFQTISHSHLRQLAHLFVVDENGNLCKKHIKPHLIPLYLSPCALAYWFMDDGGKACSNRDYTRRGLVFNTQGFEKHEVEMLCQGLRTRYHIRCWPRPTKGGFVIVISGQNSRIFMDCMAPYLHESMSYKLPH